MKAFLLTAAAFLVGSCSLFAQNLPPDYFWEVGVNAGYSTITRPTGPAHVYQGTSTKVVKDFSVKLNYFLNPNWMLHLDIGNRHWESYGNWQVNDELGKKLDHRKITFVVADNAINENVGISYVIPFYTRYNTYNKANLYFGANVGLMQSTNDGSISYSKYNAAPDSSLTYMSGYNYAPGTGYNFGIQVGYTWFVIPRLGINIELGARYARFRTQDQHYASVNSKFHLLYFPQTLGIRWRF